MLVQGGALLDELSGSALRVQAVGAQAAPGLAFVGTVGLVEAEEGQLLQGLHAAAAAAAGGAATH